MAKEKKTMPIPSHQQFALSKVKLAKNGGLTVVYEITEVIGEESYTNKFLVESAKDIHPDLKKLFEELKPILARIFHVTSFLSLIEIADFKATDEQKESARKFSEETLKNVEVRGLSFSGQDDNVGVVLTGLMTSGNNQKTAINSPRLKFNSETYGFEEELESISSNIEQEVYDFLFKGKKAQLSLFGSAESEEEKEEDEHKQVSIFPDVDDPAEEDEDEGDGELGDEDELGLDDY